MSFKTQVPKLTESYELVLVENLTDGESIVAPSTGENQILSLSFIGSIIDRVRYWSKKHSLIGLDNSSFPIVMDSPFGTLDENYRRQIAHLYPVHDETCSFLKHAEIKPKTYTLMGIQRLKGVLNKLWFSS